MTPFEYPRLAGLKSATRPADEANGRFNRRAAMAKTKKPPMPMPGKGKKPC